MRGVPNPGLKAEAIRLRVEERLSLNAIQEVTGASKGSLSTWLGDYPLTEEEKRQAMCRGGRKGAASKKARGLESLLHQMRPAKDFTGQQKAKVAEAAVLLRLVVWGFNPFGSMFDGDKTDWLVEVPNSGKVLRIQVKWASVKGSSYGLPTIPLRCSQGHSKARRYQAGEFDFVVGYDYFTDTCYVWSWSEVAGQTLKTIDPDASERWDKLGAVVQREDTRLAVSE